jgi:hypothetical protein
MNSGSTAVISIFVIPEASLSALADIGKRRERSLPMNRELRAPSNQPSNAHNGVEEMLRELVAQRIPISGETGAQLQIGGVVAGGSPVNEAT